SSFQAILYDLLLLFRTVLNPVIHKNTPIRSTMKSLLFHCLPYGEHISTDCSIVKKKGRGSQ
ncbi:MAG: hypothetical protein IJI45_07080, partial [Anaerolineaceae bacterium]|nr:hypothetical protein [Anaerolineaceae bacterium]